jgi:hypothetical protein
MRVWVSRKKSCGRERAARLVCVVVAACTLSCAAPVGAAAEPPQYPEPPRLPTVGGSGGENLAPGIYWGLYEESGSPDYIGIVGAPMPFRMGLMDNGEHRLFIFIQHRLPGGPYCAETPAQLEDLSIELTAPEGDPTIPGPEYSKTYLWTPTEAGDYAFCAYLDASPVARPAAINFVKLTADPAPGHLSFTVIPEAGDSQRVTVQVQGEAPVPSRVSASVQEHGQPGRPCTRPDGGLAGPLLPESAGAATSGGAPRTVGPGTFSSSYTFTAPGPGAYEACAYLVPSPTEQMDFWRPYEVGSTDFLVEEEPVRPAPAQQVAIPVAAQAPPPALHDVSVTNSRFRVAASRAHHASRAPLGTTFRFAVSEPASVTIAIARLLPGVSRRGHCAPLGARAVATPKRRCDRSVAVGSIVRSSVAAGSDAIPFSGVIGHRKLAAGSYTAAVSAHNADGLARSVNLRFNIVP